MCRSIVRLRSPEGPASRDEIEGAALQYIRKVSGFRKPSQANTEVFERAVAAVADATQKMLGDLVVRSPGR